MSFFFRKWFCLLILLLYLISAFFSCSTKKEEETVEEKWPDEVKYIKIKSSLDGVEQEAMFYVPPTEEKNSGKTIPLVVALHTWSGDFSQISGIEYYKRCKNRGWILIYPDFRGPNKNPDACGSPKAVQDVLDAVDYAIDNSNVDRSRIYLIGASGGGYMSLLMAGKSPDIWAAVSAWVPITDLTAWYYECKDKNLKYADDIAASCGGIPESSGEVALQYKNRSPIGFLSNAAGIPIDINAGIHDGHTGSVPISHSLNAFNILAEVNGFSEKIIPKDLIKSFVENEAVPEKVKNEKPEDQSYSKEVLFQRTAGSARVTIFEGGHECLHDAAFEWLSKQKK